LGGLHARTCPSAGGAPASNLSVMVLPAVAKYPEGTKRLTGADKEYIVAPLMSIIEESYTVYFDFQRPNAGSHSIAPEQQSSLEQ